MIEASGLEEVPEAFFLHPRVNLHPRVAGSAVSPGLPGWLRHAFSGGKQPRKFCPVAGNVHVYVIK